MQQERTFRSSFPAAIRELTALACLAERPMYSYELVREMEERIDEQINSKYKITAGIYPLIQRLAKTGLLEERKKEVSESSRLRIYYALTPLGEMYLEAAREAAKYIYSLI